ncbi:MAG: S41 family peptidase, partial [Cyclobacteriaceae bacterium]
STNENQQIDQSDALYSFAKLYGDAKYFCPSDEAANIDWDAFAYYGVSEIINSSEDIKIEELLGRLFDPIVPMLEIGAEVDTLDYSFKQFSEGRDISDTISWQHYGHGDFSSKGYYKSKRTKRKNKSYYKDQSTFNYVLISDQYIVADSLKILFDFNFQDKSIRSSAKFFIGANDKYGKVKYIHREFTNKSGYQNITLVTGIEDTVFQTSLVFGLYDEGEVEIDNLILETWKNGRWVRQNIVDFETSDKSVLLRENTNNKYYSSIIAEDENQNRRLQVKAITNFEDEKDSLFKSHTHLGDFVKDTLNSNLIYKFPIALPGNSQNTFPKTNLKILKSKLDSIAQLSYNTENKESKISNLIILSNIFRFFYPYKEDVQYDWATTLKELIENVDTYSHKEVIARLLSEIEDGHGRIQDKSNSESYKILPLKIEITDSKPIVSAAFVDSLNHLVGAELIAVNDTIWDKYFEFKRRFISGATSKSTLYKLSIDIKRLYNDPKSLTFKKPNIDKNIYLTSGHYLNASDYFLLQRNYYDSIIAKNSNLAIKYYNMSTWNEKNFFDKLKSIMEQDIIILDARDMFRHFLIQNMQHFLSETDTTKWLFVPLLFSSETRYHPDWQPLGWKYTEQKDHFKGKIFFLTNASIKSYGESIAAYFEKLPIVTVVGQPTAGTNGDINKTYLPGGFTVIWTGTKVLKHDGSQLHGIGITPDVYVERTQKGIAEGRDEVLEKAIELAKAELEKSDTK